MGAGKQLPHRQPVVTLMLKITIVFIAFMVLLVVAACIALWWTFKAPKREDYE